MNEETPMPEGTEHTEHAENPVSTDTTTSFEPVGTTQALGARDSSWHRVHIPHLVMGLAFLGLVAVWAIVVPLNAVELSHARWLLPLPWLAAGAAGLVATVFSGRRRP